MPPIATIIFLLLKYGPTVVRLIKQIVALIEDMRKDAKACMLTCAALQRDLDTHVELLRNVPTPRPVARQRLTTLRDQVLRARDRR